MRIGFDNEPLDSGSEEEAPIGSDHLTYDDQEIEHEFSAEDNIKKPRGKSKRPFRFLESDDDSQDDQPKAPMFGTFQSRVNAFSKISPPPKVILNYFTCLFTRYSQIVLLFILFTGTI